MQDRKGGVWALSEQHSPSSDACDVKVCRFWLIACLACGPQLVYHQVHTKQAESLALWVCIYLWAERIASLQTFFALLNLVSCVCNLLTALRAGVRTASVIIALTDGELQDAQFYYAEQEVSHFYVYPN